MGNSIQRSEKSFDRCMADLHNSAICVSDKQFTQLINDFDCDPLAIKVLISYLNYWHNNQLKGLENIPILHSKNHNQALERLLVGYEKQFQNCAEIILLYLISLSDKPVPKNQIKKVFSSTFIRKILLRHRDYQKFLSPLSKLSKQDWKKVTSTLCSLHLLQLHDSGDESVLYMEKRICQHFRHSLSTHYYHIFQYAYEDMSSISDSFSTDIKPEISSSKISSDYSLPSKTMNAVSHSSTEQYVTSPIAASDTYSQLQVLRQSLQRLQAHTQKLNELLSSTYIDQQVVEEMNNQISKAEDIKLCTN